MRPLHRYLKQLSKKLLIEEDDKIILLITINTPLNWKDIVDTQEEHNDNFITRTFIFKDGAEYISQTQLNGFLTDDEELEANKYIHSLSPNDIYRTDLMYDCKRNKCKGVCNRCIRSYKHNKNYRLKEHEKWDEFKKEKD